MKVAVAFDHRGVHLRDAVLEALAGHSVVDLGTDTDAVRIDYPDKARRDRRGDPSAVTPSAASSSAAPA